MATGIRVRHATDCGKQLGAVRCSCKPTYEAWVAGGTSASKLRRSFKSEAAAKAWRAQAQTAINRGELHAGPTRRVREAADELLAGMRAGTITNRSGDTYKPSAIRSYDEALRLYVKPAIGAMRLSEIRHRHVQQLVTRLRTDGKSPSTIRNAVMPLRVIFRRAIRDGEVTVNPCANLELPAVRGRRERIPTPQESAALLVAMPERDRALWATALYAGLRRGELRGLEWGDIDFEANVIRVRRSIDARGDVIEPKSAAGRRTVPIPSALRVHLLEQRMRNGAARYVFGHDRPFEPTGVADRAAKACAEPFGLHECRHAYASFMIAAGVNAKTLSAYLGHASITVTIDRYGHLFPGNESEAAGLLDAYLARENGATDGASTR